MPTTSYGNDNTINIWGEPERAHISMTAFQDVCVCMSAYVRMAIY